MKRVFGVASTCAAAALVTMGAANAAIEDVGNGDPNLLAQQQIRHLAVGTDIAADTWVFTPPASNLTCYWAYVPYPGHDAQGTPYSPWPDTVHLVGPTGWTEHLTPSAIIETNCYMHR
ncbi:hypothetical protein [Nocardia sp. CDC160]|uniref:hypothetical protein n=1 Tax=Nocardia sp. CDC160 TaxID=3112166 RepID=UPI002DBAFCD8|nr:hypothetical protein [Nocardia sp. CDC160]MEC3913465.1 hypothetical protein [Nocardia sp. CDC160]